MEQRNKSVLVATLIVLAFGVLIMLYQHGTPKDEGDNQHEALCDRVYFFREKVNRMISCTSEEISRYVINEIQFVSLLFYSNEGKDSVMVAPGPIEFYPNYHFFGYSIENGLVMAFGYDQIEQQSEERLKELLLMTYNIKYDEKDYHDFCLRASNNASACGPVRFKLFELTLPE